MFNPEQLKQKYEIKNVSPTGVSQEASSTVYSLSKPSDLDLELYLDGTGVTDQMLLPPGPAKKTVAERVEEFLAMAYRVNGETHQPNFLLVTWGDFWGSTGFRCLLKSVEITYTRFERNGSPLRAKMDVSLKESIPREQSTRATAATSPDLTHHLVVLEGDTLPGLTRKIYGSTEHVALVARTNGLDSLRTLRPGQELAFPALTLADGRSSGGGS